MGDVVRLEQGGAARANGAPLPQPATVIILPVVRIERASDHWQELPSDSAPPYVAPDTDTA
jgi:hypothetical protein